MIRLRDSGRRFAPCALAILALAGCDRNQGWEMAYIELRAIPRDPPVSDKDLKQRDAIRLFELQGRDVFDPNAAVAPAQALAVVRSLGVRADVNDDCTGFFISEEEFLTARHCVAAKAGTSESEIDIDFGEKLGTIKATCAIPPEPEDWQDWAICRLQEEVSPAGTFPLTRCAPEPGTHAVIMGFCKGTSTGGASAETGPGEPNAGVVELLALEGGFLPARPEQGRRTLACPLDSGGPAFIAERLDRTPEGIYIASGEVRIVGIISQIRTCPEGATDRTCIAPTTDASFFDFLEDHASGSATVLDCDE